MELSSARNKPPPWFPAGRIFLINPDMIMKTGTMTLHMAACPQNDP